METCLLAVTEQLPPLLAPLFQSLLRILIDEWGIFSDYVADV
jgi:hypothetical protein